MPYSLNCATAPVDNPQQIGILLHGYGANGKDLIGLAPTIQQFFPNMAFIAPDAPNICAQNPSGFEWFNLEDFSMPTMQRGADTVLPKLLSFLASVTDHHQVAYHDLVFIGFSQGTAMALHTLLGLEQCPKAVVGFSGFLATPEPKARTSKPCPVHLVHGNQDNVVPAQASQIAQQQLQDIGFATSYYACDGLAHGINDKGLESTVQFLQRTL